MSARAVSKYTQILTGGVGAVFLRFLGPDDRRIIMFDSNVEWWHVEARRGHGPHGSSRRRARSSAGRVRGRREAAMLVDQERRADKKSRSVRSGVRNRTYIYVIPHYGSAPDHTRPEGVDRVGNHIMVQTIKHAGGRRGARATPGEAR